MAVDAMVHADLRLALSAVMELLRVADGLIEADIDAQLAPVRDLDWLFPVQQFTEWKVVAKMVADALARVAISASVEAMTQASDALVKVVPTWAHLVDGSKFNLKAADKHLVKWPSKGKMNEGAVRLELAMKSAGELSTLWGLLRPVEDDEQWKAEFGHIRNVYGDAKKVIALTAAVNQLVNVAPSKERTNKATATMKANVAWLPKGLVDAIRRLK